MGLILNDNLARLNALKQSIAFSANVAAAALFVFSGKIHWPVALVMMPGLCWVGRWEAAWPAGSSRPPCAGWSSR